MTENHSLQQIGNDNQRVACFDIARGIGILLMVMGHTGFGDVFCKIIYTFHMPLFFFLSGYFYRPERFACFKDYCFHQMKTLLLPYVVFCLLYQPLHVIYTGEFSARYMLLSLISSNHNRIDVAGAMWFLLCLFSAKMIFHSLNIILKNRNVFAVVIVALTLCGNLMRKFCMLPFAMDTALSNLFVMYLGVLAYTNKDSKCGKKVFHAPWWVCTLLLGFLLAAALLNMTVVVRRNNYGNLALFWVSCLSGILFVMNIACWLDRCKNRAVKVVAKIFCFWGKESLVYLVLNELTIFAVVTTLTFLGVPKALIDSCWLIQFVVVLAVMTILALVSLLVDNTPLKVLFGKKWNTKAC